MKPDSKKKQYAEKAAKRSSKARERIENSGDKVAIDSDQSFPASDPPSWTGVTGPATRTRTKSNAPAYGAMTRTGLPSRKPRMSSTMSA
jgi:hypothetical protein